MFLFIEVYCSNLIILLLFIFDMITLCLEILIYTHCLHFLILYSSLNLFHRDCSCCSSHVDKFDGYFFFLLKLVSPPRRHFLPLVRSCPRGKLWFSSVSKTPVHDPGMFNRWWIAGTQVLFFSCSRRKKKNSVLRLQRLLKRSVQKGAKNEEGCTSLLRFTRSFWKQLWTYIWEYQSHTGTRKSYWIAREFDLRKSSRNDEGYGHNKF